MFALASGHRWVCKIPPTTSTSKSHWVSREHRPHESKRRAPDRQVEPRQRAAHHLARLRNRFLGFGEVNSPGFREVLFGPTRDISRLGNARRRGWTPLPVATAGSPSGRGVVRRLATTLASLTPINPQQRNYRRAKLWLELDGRTLGVEKKDVDMKAEQRGTVQYLVLEGRKVVTHDETDCLDIIVSCRADAGMCADPRQTFLMSDLKEITSYSNDSIRKYAKMALGEESLGSVGKKAFRYERHQVVIISKTILEHSNDETARSGCRRWRRPRE